MSLRRARMEPKIIRTLLRCPPPSNQRTQIPTTTTIYYIHTTCAAVNSVTSGKLVSAKCLDNLKARRLKMSPCTTAKHPTYTHTHTHACNGCLAIIFLCAELPSNTHSDTPLHPLESHLNEHERACRCNDPQPSSTPQKPVVMSRGCKPASLRRSLYFDADITEMSAQTSRVGA